MIRLRVPTATHLFSACIMTALLAALTAGMVLGAKFSERHITAAMGERAEVDRKITAWIVKRNPEASIKDFAGFPEYLIAESERAGLDFRLVMAVIDKESEWKPSAVSQVGAVGLMQLMPKTADLVVAKLKAEGYEPPVAARSGVVRYASLGSLGDPRWSVRLGLAYLRWQMDEYGIGADSLRAYNRGPGKAMLAGKGDRYAEDVALKFVALAHMVDRR